MIHSHLLFMSGMDITMILAVALLLFGGKKLPELARGLGSGIKEFKDATSGVTNTTINTPSGPVETMVPTPVKPTMVEQPTHATAS